MYTIFIPKYQYEKTEYLITKVISLYMKSSCCNCIISSPGYMSKYSNTINMFVNELGNRMSGNKPYIGFFNGMNGSLLLNNGPTTIRGEHEQQVRSSVALNLLPICCRTIKDHRKMMFFINYNGGMPSILDKKHYKDFLSKCTVCGVLIGSSNQSLETYFGGSSFSSAKKGEADILMYTDDKKTITKGMEAIQTELLNRTNFMTDFKHMNIRILESIDTQNYNPKEENAFFKEILTDFLKKNLTK